MLFFEVSHAILKFKCIKVQHKLVHTCCMCLWPTYYTITSPPFPIHTQKATDLIERSLIQFSTQTLKGPWHEIFEETMMF